MAKSTKELIIEAICKEIGKGIARSKVLAHIGTKWQISARSFARYWKIANDRFIEKQDRASKAADEAYIASIAADASKQLTMSKYERWVLLSQIARGEIKICTYEVKFNPITKKYSRFKTIQLPSFNARIKAVEEMNKMEGDYAPQKIAQTDAEGNDINQANLKKLSSDELLTLIALNEKMLA